MAAPLRNDFWKQRSSHGRKPIFASPDDLWDACEQYFEWTESNPLQEDGLVTFQGNVKHEPIAKLRAMTIDGLCIFLDIGRQTWNDYCAREAFSAVTTRAEAIIRQQKFQGAAAGLLNPNIIARDLGLAEKQEHSGQVALTPTINLNGNGS